MNDSSSPSTPRSVAQKLLIGSGTTLHVWRASAASLANEADVEAALDPSRDAGAVPSAAGGSEGNNVIAPGADLVGALPDEVIVVHYDGDVPHDVETDIGDVLVVIVRDARDLEQALTKALSKFQSVRARWIAYPKGGASDVNRDSIWQRVERDGLRLNANVAIDDVWSAVRVANAH